MKTLQVVMAAFLAVILIAGCGKTIGTTRHLESGPERVKHVEHSSQIKPATDMVLSTD